MWSNSYYNGAATPKNIKSKGNPSYKSDTGIAATNMTWASPAGGNPLRPTNYFQNYKWGNPMKTKWSAGYDIHGENGGRYEGEGLITAFSYLELFLLITLM